MSAKVIDKTRNYAFSCGAKNMELHNIGYSIKSCIDQANEIQKELMQEDRINQEDHDWYAKQFSELIAKLYKLYGATEVARAL